MNETITFSEKANCKQFKKFFAKVVLLLFLLIGYTTVFGQTKTTVTTAGITSFTAPTGVTSVTVQAWGAGGAGGGSNLNKNPPSGGGGGAYNFSNSVTVSPGTTYTNSVVVGTGGAGAVGVSGTNGTASSVGFGSSLSANGGNGGAGNAPNTGSFGNGGAAGSFAGGNGGSPPSPANLPGGGGGSSAGTASAGISGTGTTAGAAVTGGGAGGAGGAIAVNGTAGSTPGGGGGGGGDKTGNTNTSGGNGASGQIIISYFLLTNTSNVTVCNGTTATITVSGTSTNLPVGSYTLIYDLASPNASTNNSTTMTVSTAGTATFTTVTLSNVGATAITITSISSTIGGIVYKTTYNATGTANNKSTITVSTNNTAGAASSTPTLCINTALTNITHTTTGATGIGSPTNLPSGVTAAWASNTITISGTPTASGTFNYNIPLTGGCGSVNATGTIIVKAASTAAIISGTAAICSGSPTNLSVAITGGTSPYTVVYTSGSLSSYTSGSNISVSPTSNTTYTLTSVTDANGCAGAGNTGSAVVTIDSTTSTNGGVSWSNGSPSAVKSVTFDGSTATIAADFSACSLRLTNNAVVTVTSGFDINLNGKLTVDSGSTFTLNNNANLLQNNTLANLGNIIVKRNSSAIKRFDYTLWSSPVTGQGLYAFSPLTVATRFYVYRTNTNFYNNADIGFNITGLDPNGVNGTDSNIVQFPTAKGYLIRMPWNHPTAAAVWNGTFTGVPNNGDITYTMTSGASGFRFNLVGNPYPSPISMSQFVSDNSAKITGTLYFWRETNNTTFNNAYCTWAGGTFTTNNEAQVFNPNGIIRTGQGFIVEALASQTVLSFKNGQRSSDNTNQFFKNNGVANSTDTVETNRFWLNITNTTGAFSQMAAGYMTAATDGVDIYDGKNINSGSTSLNSILNNEDYTIQGKSLPFNSADILPLSCKITNPGSYTIAIDHADGLFADVSQPIYLKDNLTTTIHDLNTGAYSFVSDAGTFSDRFEIIYALPLGTETPIFTTNNVVIYTQNSEFVVNTANVIMASVKVFDIRGRLLLERKEINASQTTIGSGLSNQVLLVQITSEDGITVTKKVIR